MNVDLYLAPRSGCVKGTCAVTHHRPPSFIPADARADLSLVEFCQAFLSISELDREWEI